MNLLLAAIVVAAVAYMVVKKYKSQTTLFVGGMVLMILAYVLGYKTEFVSSKNSLGLPLFDMFEYISLLFSKDAAHLGLMIMAITGFAKYMDHIGASVVLSKCLNQSILLLSYLYPFDGTSDESRQAD